MRNRLIKNYGGNKRTLLLKRGTTSKKAKRVGIKTLLILLGMNLVLALAKLSPTISDWTCVNVSRPMTVAVRTLTSTVPFSVFEAVVIAVVIFAVAAVATFVSRLIRRTKTAARLLCVAASAVLAFTFVYNVFTGFSYSRNKLDFPGFSPESREQAVTITQTYFQDFYDLASRLETDENGRAVCPYTTEELADVIQQEYDRLCAEYPEIKRALYSEHVPVKLIMNSWFMSESNVSGIYFALTGEANLNADMPVSQSVVSMAHECAHGKGVMKEDEANALAYLLTLTARDDYVRFAGYLATYDRMAEVLYYYDKDAFEQIKATLPDVVREEVLARRQFWASHGKLDKIADFFNDLYLKLSGYVQGISGYRDVSNVTSSVNPDTGETEYVIDYSTIQKIIFDLYG